MTDRKAARQESKRTGKVGKQAGMRVAIYRQDPWQTVTDKKNCHKRSEVFETPPLLCVEYVIWECDYYTGKYNACASAGPFELSQRYRPLLYIRLYQWLQSIVTVLYNLIIFNKTSIVCHPNRVCMCLVPKPCEVTNLETWISDSGDSAHCTQH